MKIVINASTVAVGGGLSVAHNLLEAFNSIDHQHEMLLISPGHCGYEKFQSRNIRILIVPRILLYRAFRVFLDYVWLPRQIIKYRPEWILSLGNLPAPISIKQALLFDNPFATLKNLSDYNLSFFNIITHKFRNVIFRRRLKYLKLVFVQTKIQQKRFQEVFPSFNSLELLPNGPIYIKQKDACDINLPQKKHGEFRLFAFSMYYPHKNLEILLEVGRILKREKLRITFIITINKKQGKKAREFLKDIKSKKLSEQIINVGKISHSNIETLYKNVDGLILPTLLESFSSTYLDAMLFEKPILTSDIDFAREVCKEAGWYFNPNSAKDIYEVIIKCKSSLQNRQEKIYKGKEIISEYISWPQIAKKCLKSLES